MVWRIYFTADDLARTRIGAPLGPLGETQLALAMLRCPVWRPAGFTGWRSRSQGLRTGQMRPFEAAIPRGSLGVDLLAGSGGAPTIGKGIDALLAMPRDSLLAEMEAIDRQSRLPRSVWAAAEEGSPARLQLAAAAEATYQVLLEPYWGRISAHVHAERVARGRILMDGGIQQLLSTLVPSWIRWRPPMLEIRHPTDQYTDLGGHGLVLTPSLFAADRPVLIFSDQALPPALVFPAHTDQATHRHLWERRRQAANPLATLMGHTRAATLHSITNGCTTTELAHRAGISAPAASQHATVLRNAGLISTRRYGSAVLHSLTPLGTELLATSNGTHPDNPGQDPARPG